MQILQLKEYAACSYLPEDPRVGFALLTGDKGETVTVIDEQMNAIGFVLAGKITIDYGEKKNVKINPGTMFLLPRGITHKLEVLEPSLGLRLYLGSKLGLCERFMLSEKKRKQRSEFRFQSLPILPVIHNLLIQIKGYIEDSRLCVHINDYKYKEFYMLMSAYYDHDCLAEFFSPVLSRNRSFRESVLRCYEERSENCNNLETFAAKLCMSRSSFIRHFKKVFGETPHEWIVRKTAMKIKCELQESEESIADIYCRHGFSSHTQFTRFCKKHLGATPKEIKK